MEKPLKNTLHAIKKVVQMKNFDRIMDDYKGEGCMKSVFYEKTEWISFTDSLSSCHSNAVIKYTIEDFNQGT